MDLPMKQNKNTLDKDSQSCVQVVFALTHPLRGGSEQTQV